MTGKSLILLGAGLLAAPYAAQAAQVGAGAFTAPTTVSFGNPGVPGAYSFEPEGLAIAPVVFTTASGAGLRWFGGGNGFNDCIGGCVTTNDFGPSTLIATLNQSYNMVGLYVGQAGAFDLAVSFFDTANVLLGTVNVSGASDGVAFAGWESSSTIGRVGIVNASSNGFVLAAQSGLFQNAAVPEPATWAMLILGFGAVGGAMRRRLASAKASRMCLIYA